MDRQIKIGENLYSYKLIRRRTNRIILSVKIDGSICVTAGKKTAVKTIESFMKSKESFIVNARDKKLKNYFNANALCEYNDGDRYIFSGEEYRVKLVNSHLNTAKVENDNLIIYCDFPWDTEKKQKLMEKFEDAQRKIVFENLSEKVYNDMKGLVKERAVIKQRKMKSCMGVCHYNKGYITMNKALIYYPKRIMLYVMYHEYIHFVYHNHSKDFYDMLDSFIPDRKKLDEYFKDREV